MTISLVQSVAFGGGSGGVYTADISTTAGNTLVVTAFVINNYNSPANLISPGVTDNASNAWNYTTSENNTSPPAAGNNDSADSIYVFVTAAYVVDAAAITGGPDAVSLYLNAQAQNLAVIFINEFSGVPASAVTDGTPGTSNTSVTESAYPTPATVITGSNDLVIAGVAPDYAPVSVNSPFALFDVGAVGAIGAWAGVTSAGSYSATFNCPGNEWFASYTMALGVPAAPAPSAPPAFWSRMRLT